MAKTYLERGAEIIEKMTLEELQQHYHSTREEIVKKASEQLSQHEAYINKLKAVKDEVSK